MTINSNIYTASKIIEKALSVADLSNTDFLSYEDKVSFLNDAWKNVYQQIINYNLNVFTVEAKLIGSGGVYNLPWDCYQIKSVKNPVSGREIPRKADSESIYGSYYEIVNNTLRLGPSAGPVTITYWRKPFFLSIPNKIVDVDLELNGRYIADVCKDSVLLRNKADNRLWIYNLLTQSELEIETDAYTIDNNFRLGNNFIISLYTEDDEQLFNVYDFNWNELLTEQIAPNDFIRSDDGVLYKAVTDTENHVIKIYNFANESPIAEISYTDDEEDFSIVCIDGEFYKTPYHDDLRYRAMPIGVFDGRPAYTFNNELHLITDNDEIVEKVSVPSIGPIINTQYGFLTFDGKLYSNIPDTELNFPNNIYYDCICYDLAIRFLCKQNADSSGVENLNRNAWSLLFNSIDQNADYPRIKIVR